METPAADALILVDVQGAWVFGADAVPAADELAASIQTLLDRARAASALVVHLQNDGREDAPDQPGTPGWRLAIEPREDERVLRKRGDDGFEGTGLIDVLLERHAETVVIGGVQSEMCVAATARGALTRGLSVVLPRDSHATYPIPAQGPNAPTVPAHHVARVAEWSLGDQVHVLDHAHQTQFTQRAR